MNREAMVRRCAYVVPLAGLFVLSCASPVNEVDEIVASNLTARGGEERIAALQSIRGTGIATASGGRVAKVTYEVKRPGLYRLEFRMQGTTAVFAHDGESGWQVDPRGGVFEPERTSPELHADATSDERDIEGPLMNWREKGNLVELVGREALPDGEAFKLKVTLADGSVRHDYIDVESRLVVRTDKTDTIRGRAVLLEETYSDFRTVDGLVLPHRIETRVADRPETISIVVDTIELDPELDDERFAFPG
jgi:outer membrane lipoprotein-sorting protein